MEAAFIAGSKGRLFCLFIPASQATARPRALLQVAAFADEMNKSRPMVIRQARAAADAGYATLILDCYGTGDSDGQFHDASWDTWVDDVRVAARWLRDRGFERIDVWGVRTGAALALDALHDMPVEVGRLIFWQPVVNGQVYLKQFLRLRRAAEIFHTAGADEDAGNGDGPVEVAGYVLVPSMSGALERIRLERQSPNCGRVVLVEVSSLPEPTLARPTLKLVQTWRDSGTEVKAEAVPGEPFWSTLEVAINDHVLDVTTRMLRDDS